MDVIAIRNDRKCDERGVPFFGEKCFLNDGASLTQNCRENAGFLHDFRRVPRPWDFFSSGISFVFCSNQFLP